MQINLSLVKITFEFNFISSLSGSQSFHSYCGKMGAGKKVPLRKLCLLSWVFGCLVFFLLYFKSL